MIKYATVGTSWITESFINGCRLLGDRLCLAGVYSRDAEKGKQFGQRFGCSKVYTDLEALAESAEIDAVYIASPNAFHYSQSKLLLTAGKHVICEKPITVTPNELEELQGLARSKGVVYMEALMARHLPAWNAVLSELENLGRISHARFDFSQRSSKYDGLLAGVHQNIFDPKMAAGALMDLGIYCVYPALGWFGEPDSIYAYCRKLSTGADGEGGAVLRFKALTAELSWSKTGESRIGSEIIGDNGTLIIPSISKLTNIRLIHKDGTEKQITAELDKPRLMSYEADKFYKYITEPGTFASDLASANELALSVSKAMCEIRRQSGIAFDM